MGRGYVIDCILTNIRQEQEERRYRAYITDALKIISENTAKFVGGKYIAQRWAEKQETVEKSGDEIAKDIIRRANLKLKEGGCE